jgi:hypothetical protein
MIAAAAGERRPSTCQSSMALLRRMSTRNRSLHAQLTTELPLCTACTATAVDRTQMREMALAAGDIFVYTASEQNARPLGTSQALQCLRRIS